MKLFKKIDGYLMRNHPALWETKAHIFLPLIWAIILILFGIGTVINVDLTEHFDFFEFIPMLFIPSIVLLVFWIISAVKFNVFKSSGKSHLGHDYLHVFIYMFTIISIFMIPFAPIFGIHQRAKLSFDMEAISQERESINKGYSILEWNRYSVDEESNGTYSIQKRSLISKDMESDENYYDYDDDAYILNRTEMIQAINNFKTSVYRVNGYEFSVDAQQYVDENLASNFSDSYQYRDELYGIENYFRNARKLGNEVLPDPFDEKELWMFILGFGFTLSSILWMFKRTNTREFIFGIISIVANPMIMGLLFAMIGVSGGFDGHGELTIIPILLILALIFYLVVAIIHTLTRGEKSWFGMLSAITFQFYTPIILFISSIMFIDEYRRSYDYNYNSETYEIMRINKELMINTSFWICLLVGFLLIIPMKMIYKKHWFLPSSK